MRRRVHACPVCFGAGTVSRPPHVPGDVVTWTDSASASYVCRACNGHGVLVEGGLTDSRVDVIRANVFAVKVIV